MGHDEISPEEPVSDKQKDLAASLERYHQLARQTRNPVYVWWGLYQIFHARLGSLLDGPIGDEFAIPGWCAEYLVAVTEKMVDLSAGIDFRVEAPPFNFDQYESEKAALGSPAWHEHVAASRISQPDAMKLVPTALGLTRDGWNAFASFEATTQKMQEFRSYEAMRARGVSASEALAVIMERAKIADERSMNRRIREGRHFATGKVAEPEG
ncbi:hypothetical protein [Roseomonas sp. BN140053]|uniref:hypothetical protein n=1 Tax=Roseomonas sp. BN140053 TaxID=3391898 RepID=UPI0039EC571C